jgi:hypothetical protein
VKSFSQNEEGKNETGPEMEEKQLMTTDALPHPHRLPQQRKHLETKRMPIWNPPGCLLWR